MYLYIQFYCFKTFSEYYLHVYSCICHIYCNNKSLSPYKRFWAYSLCLGNLTDFDFLPLKEEQYLFTRSIFFEDVKKQNEIYSFFERKLLMFDDHLFVLKFSEQGKVNGQLLKVLHQPNFRRHIYPSWKIKLS